MILIGALFAAGIMWASKASNRLYELQVSPIGTSSLNNSGVLNIAYDNPEDVKVQQMTQTMTPPPIDSKLPENLEVATFALG